MDNREYLSTMYPALLDGATVTKRCCLSFSQARAIWYFGAFTLSAIIASEQQPISSHLNSGIVGFKCEMWGY